VATLVADGLLPGAAVAVGTGSSVLFRYHTGYARLRGGRPIPLTRTTLFDLASVTKVMATLPCVLAACDEKLVELDMPVASAIPGFHADVTVRHLLCHVSGLPAGRPLWRRHGDREQIVRSAMVEPLAHHPGTQVTYSDLGFISLGELLERVHGRSLDEIVARRVTGPLALTATGFRPSPGFRTAATEVDVKGRAIQGVVHDENAAAMGGIAGHAGLFASLDDVAAYAAEWAVGAPRLLPAGLVREAIRCQTTGLGGRRGLGWVCAGDSMDQVGSAWPESTISHTGFTGTAMAVEPRSGHWAVILTNAVHLGRFPRRSRGIRRQLFSLMAEALGRDRPAARP
jgi:CubicO group peptidase (beta-lactamase class C family)